MNLDSVFGCLADPTRRDILQQVAAKELSIGEIAARYDLTFAAISKHLKILEKAQLVIKQRRGKQQMVHMNPQSLTLAQDYLKQYEQLLNDRFDALDTYLKVTKGGT